MVYIVVLFLLLGITIAVLRIFKNLGTNVVTNQLIKRMQQNPAYLKKIAEKISTIYGRFKIEDFQNLFQSLLEIPENHKLGKFTLLKVFPISEQKILCITVCSSKSYNLFSPSELGDVNNKLQIKFLINKNFEKSQYEFYSDIFDDLNDKNLKMGFKDELITFLQKNK